MDSSTALHKQKVARKMMQIAFRTFLLQKRFPERLKH